MTDERLLTLARNGEEQAFLDLYQRYRDPLFRFACRLTSSRETSEDLVHDCFIGILKARSHYSEERATLKTYLYAAIRNLARKHYRDTDEPESVPPDLADGAADCLSVLIGEETSRIVQQTIAGMPSRWREVLILADYEELSMTEIAEITGDQLSAVKVRLHRARQALKRSLMENMQCKKTT